MKIMRVRALVRKEWLQVIRDPSTLLISFFLPFLLLFLYGYGLSLDLDHLRLGLVMEDTAPDAQVLAQSFIDSRYFDVTLARDKRELEEKIIDGSIRGMVIIPSYFSQFRKRPDTVAPVMAIADGSETNTANFVLSYAQGAFGTFLAQERRTPLIQLERRVWYNEPLESRYNILSGALAIIMTTVGALLTALVVAKEWERGTMEAMISTQVTKGEIVISKTFPYFILGMAAMMICSLLTVTLFGVPFRGSWWALILVSMVFLLCSVGVGLVVSTYAKNQAFAYQLAMVAAFLPAYILSGFLFEVSSMPAWIRFISNIMPATYFVQSLQTFFLVGDVWPLIFLDLIPLVIAAVVLLTAAYFLTPKRLD